MAHISNSETTLYGVPQGSVLGPLLFLLYVNDIANSSKHLSFYLFADDTSIIYANKNLHNLEQIVNSELSNVSDWLLANKLTLNFKKSNYVLFRPRQKCLTYNPSIKAYDSATNALSTLEKKDFVKYLGVLIDYELSWKNHINLICLKISRTVGILAKLRHSIPLRPLLNIYQALINPYLYYGICAWGYAPKTYLNKILLIQKRAPHLIYFTDYKQHAVPFFLKSKVFPLSFIYFDCLCSIMWDVANNSAPENIKRAFTRISEVHSYPTRSSLNDDFYTEHSRLEKMRSSFLRVGPKIWNSLPSDMRNLPKSTFRKKIRNKLFEILSKSDDYLEITEIMHQLKFN